MAGTSLNLGSISVFFLIGGQRHLWIWHQLVSSFWLVVRDLIEIGINWYILSDWWTGTSFNFEAISVFFLIGGHTGRFSICHQSLSLFSFLNLLPIYKGTSLNLASTSFLILIGWQVHFLIWHQYIFVFFLTC